MKSAFLDSSKWDSRYSSSEFVYGKEPNDFLVRNTTHIPPGRVLCLASGEGRNAVYLARQGYQVTAVDGSSAGCRKARELAAEQGAEVNVVCADLESYDLGTDCWQGVTAIFCHLPPDIRRMVHARAAASLSSGGVLILEAYTPKQLAFKTGGPPDVSLMMTLDALREELGGLELEHAVEIERSIHEGSLHHGVGAVVQVRGRKTDTQKN